MDKKEKKRDVAAFSHMMKELMQQPTNDSLVTLDRDIQHFIYGRVATLVKHNESKPIGSIGDISCVVGAALAEVLKEFTKGRATEEKTQELFENAKSELIRGFVTRSPAVKVQVPEPVTEETVEQ